MWQVGISFPQACGKTGFYSLSSQQKLASIEELTSQLASA